MIRYDHLVYSARTLLFCVSLKIHGVLHPFTLLGGDMCCISALHNLCSHVIRLMFHSVALVVTTPLRHLVYSFAFFFVIPLHLSRCSMFRGPPGEIHLLTWHLLAVVIANSLIFSQESITKVLPSVHGLFLARVLRHMLDAGIVADRDYERLAFVHQLLLSDKCQVRGS